MRRALLVGVDHYPTIRPLSGCVADASALADVPRTHADGSPNFRVELITSNPGVTTVTGVKVGDIGQLNIGDHQTVNNIDSHIAALVRQGKPKVGAALQRLAEVTLSDPELDQQTQAELLVRKGGRDGGHGARRSTTSVLTLNTRASRSRLAL